jgi:branched-chain amino acid transport system ATP-binding protein
MSPLLATTGLKRHFGGVWASAGIDLDICEGELHALIGPNGAGKTTLVHLISGGLPPDAGRIDFAGTRIDHLGMHDRVALGIVRSYQITQVFPALSLLENVRLAVQARRRGWGDSLRCWRPASADFAMIEEAEEWLGRVGLAEQAGSRAADVSHGTRRALELAMALATRPRLLLLDEPLAGMGPEESLRMARLIASLKGSMTVMLIEHDMDVVFDLADRISVLVAGRIVACGAPDAIRSDAEVKRAYLGDASG